MKNFNFTITGFTKDENNNVFADTSKGDMFVSLGSMTLESFTELGPEERIAKLRLQTDGNRQYLKVVERTAL